MVSKYVYLNLHNYIIANGKYKYYFFKINIIKQGRFSFNFLLFLYLTLRLNLLFEKKIQKICLILIELS